MLCFRRQGAVEAHDITALQKLIQAAYVGEWFPLRHALGLHICRQLAPVVVQHLHSQCMSRLPSQCSADSTSAHNTKDAALGIVRGGERELCVKVPCIALANGKGEATHSSK